MSEEIAIKVDGVSKTFHEGAGAKSFKQIFVGIGDYLTGKSKNKPKKGDFTALKDISFDVKKGEFFGIVGRNGSGKSTLLKILAGVYTPSSGSIAINGKLTPFIELGVGFNPELTGKDNVFLNGALLGFSRKQMELMYDDIVEFAELHNFMDTKLKHYSSGMQVRLAFSIAIRAQSDILLLDEVLAVGDEAFQQKCFDYFDNLRSSKKTVILVTHNMGVVDKYCDRALLIDKGNFVDIGDSRKISGMYMSFNEKQAEEEKKTESIEDHDFIRSNGTKYEIINKTKSKNTRIFDHGDTLQVDLSWNNLEIKNIGIAIIKSTGEYIYGANTMTDKVRNINGNITYTTKLNLTEGKYRIMIAFFKNTKYQRLHLLEKNLNFRIKTKNLGWSGIVKLDNKWRI